jgi:hypothetical protein
MRFNVGYLSGQERKLSDQKRNPSGQKEISDVRKPLRSGRWTLSPLFGKCWLSCGVV